MCITISSVLGLVYISSIVFVSGHLNVNSPVALELTKILANAFQCIEHGLSVSWICPSIRMRHCREKGEKNISTY